MPKVLVTGATGFIGNHVVEALLHKKIQVVATSLSAEKAVKMPWYNSVTYIPFDLSAGNDSKDYYDLFQQPEAIIHLAWEGLPNYKNDFHVTENYPRHYSFLKNLVDNGLRNITVTGTCFEYGLQEGELSEDSPALPDNYYAQAKDMLRKELETLCRGAGCSLKWVRLFYMFGEGQHPKSLIPQLEKALAEGSALFNMSGGEQVRDFLPVNRVAEHLVNIAMQQKITGTINCSSGIPIKVKDFVSQYLDERQASIQLNLGYYPYADYEPFHFWGNNAKLKTIEEY